MLNENSTVNEVISYLQGCFPFLRFEFYKSDVRSPSDQRLMLLPHLALGILTGNRTLSLCLDEDKRISELKDDFRRIGIEVVIYRKAGNVWVETKLTGDWTLKMQNAEGEIFSR